MRPRWPLPLAETPAVEPANVTEAQEAPNVRPFEAALDFNAELPAFENYLPGLPQCALRHVAGQAADDGACHCRTCTGTAATRDRRTAECFSTASATRDRRTAECCNTAAAGLNRHSTNTAGRDRIAAKCRCAAPGADFAARSCRTVRHGNHRTHACSASLGTADGKSRRDAERRGSRPRARHARNVRPEPAGGLSAELWAKAPRHLQALLALEKLQQAEEIAQSSYKRPFTEGRRELIERLLDPVLSLEDTARLLGVCPTTVRRYTNRGILTHYRKEPRRTTKAEVETETGKETRQRRFRLSDILTFLETQQSALEADRRSEKERAQRKISDTRTAVPSS